METKRAEIDWLPINAVASILDLHETQVRRDRAVLIRLDLINTPRKGLLKWEFDCLKLFRQLVDERGREQAINVISEAWEYERTR